MNIVFPNMLVWDSLAKIKIFHAMQTTLSLFIYIGGRPRYCSLTPGLQETYSGPLGGRDPLKEVSDASQVRHQGGAANLPQT